MGAAQVDSELTLTVYRQGQEMEITVTVGEKTQEALPTEEPGSENGSDANTRPGEGGQEDWQQFGDSFEDFLREFGREYNN